MKYFCDMTERLAWLERTMREFPNGVLGNTLRSWADELATLRASLAQQGEAVHQLRAKIGGGWFEVSAENYRDFSHSSSPYEYRKLFTHPAAVGTAPEDRVDVALAAYNRADYQWVQRDKDDRDEPRHRFAMRAAVAALLPATSEGDKA